MEDLNNEYKNYWETTMFFQELEFNSWPMDEAFSGSSGSPDGAETLPASSKNVVSERNRRQKLNERLFTLRSIVPNISKMDKASIIKDSITYMKELVDQEKKLEAEISELKSQAVLLENQTGDYDRIDNYLENQQNINVQSSKKHKKMDYSTIGSTVTRVQNRSPIEVLGMNVTWMGEKTVLVSMTCSKRRDTMLQLSKVLESSNLNILTTSFSSCSSRLSSTLILQADEEESNTLEAKIQRAITAYNNF